VQQARQHRPAAVGAGGVLLQDCGAACSAEFVALRVGSLFIGRDPRIADQAAGSGSFLVFGWHGGGRPLWWGDFTDQQGVCKRSFDQVAGPYVMSLSGSRAGGLPAISAATREDLGRFLPSSRADPVGIAEQKRGLCTAKIAEFRPLWRG
jgi:hypothetical protein